MPVVLKSACIQLPPPHGIRYTKLVQVVDFRLEIGISSRKFSSVI